MMSSFGVRKPIRTYSRQGKRPLRDEEPPAKRRRVDAHPDTAESAPAYSSQSSPLRDIPISSTSSPGEAAVVSSDDAPKSTPPSSPTSGTSPPPAQARRPIFAFLKKKSISQPLATDLLSECNRNVDNPTKPPPKKRRLVQMQLDLASETHKTCKVCGMGYVPSNAEDAALHRKFHAMNVGGVDFTKAFVERLRQNQVWAGGDGSFIAVIGRKDTAALRSRASDVLKVVTTELGAIPIADEALWSQIRTTGEDTKTQGEGAEKGNRACSTSDRFKAYLYVRGQKCVGLCLAERIHEACTVLDQGDVSKPAGQLLEGFQGSSISISEATEPAMLGISRIWTSNLQRKQGIATRLLDSARSEFQYGMTIDKAKVAFSQPTESGGKLARKWFGRQAGWHVYVD